MTKAKYGLEICVGEDIGYAKEFQVLKTKYEFIHFEKIADKPRTSVWVCVNNKSGDRLGMVSYFNGWRQYCFAPYSDTVYSAGCMRDIIKFMADLREYEVNSGKGKHNDK